MIISFSLEIKNYINHDVVYKPNPTHDNGSRITNLATLKTHTAEQMLATATFPTFP